MENPSQKGKACVDGASLNFFMQLCEVLAAVRAVKNFIFTSFTLQDLPENHLGEWSLLV